MSACRYWLVSVERGNVEPFVKEQSKDVEVWLHHRREWLVWLVVRHVNPVKRGPRSLRVIDKVPWRESPEKLRSMEKLKSQSDSTKQFFQSFKKI